MNAPVFVIVFAAAYAMAYLFAVEQNHALFTYHPAIHEFGWGVQPPRDGPAMYWYGWLATAGIVALVVSAVASVVPQRVADRLSPAIAWIIPLLALAAFAWLLRDFFLR